MRKRGKRFLSALLALCMVLAMIPMSASATSTSSSQKEIADAYVKFLTQKTYQQFAPNVTFDHYSYLDIDQNGIPELILLSESDSPFYTWEVFSYNQQSKSIVCVKSDTNEEDSSAGASGIFYGYGYPSYCAKYRSLSNCPFKPFSWAGISHLYQFDGSILTALLSYGWDITDEPNAGNIGYFISDQTGTKTVSKNEYYQFIEALDFVSLEWTDLSDIKPFSTLPSPDDTQGAAPDFSLREDVWSFSNSIPGFLGRFGDRDKGYYITSNDYNRLLSNLEPTEQQMICFDGKGMLSYNVDGKSGKEAVGSWGGSCYGMSAWVWLNHAQILSADNIKSGAKNLHSLNADNASRSAINYYHRQWRLPFPVKTVNEFMSRSQMEQLDQLEALCQQAAQTGILVIISFQWTKSFNDDGTVKVDEKGNPIETSHAVIGYGIEYGTWVKETVPGYTDTFNKRILIYDCAYPDGGEDYYLYFNDDYLWSIPGRNIRSMSSQRWDRFDDNAALQCVTADVKFINTVSYNSGAVSSSEKEAAQAYILTTPAEALYILEVCDATYNVSIFGATNMAGGQNLNVMVAPNVTMDNETVPTSASIVLPDDTTGCTVSSEDDTMAFSLYSGNYFESAVADAPGTVTFAGTGEVTMQTDAQASYSINVTANDGYTTIPWNTVEVSGSDATEITASLQENGVEVTGDNLENLTVVATGNQETAVTASSDLDSVLITEKNGALTVCEDQDGDGTFETEISQPVSIFTFTDDNSAGTWTWASEYIYACYDAGIISGISNGDGTFRFEPDGSLTRAQAAVLFCEAMRLMPVDSPSVQFADDTSAGTWSWAAKYIYACKQAGVISGYEDGTFQPDKTITRAEFSVMMAQALELSTNVSVTSFPDDTGTGSWKWAGPSIYACKAVGIVSGDGVTGKFNPDNTITRAQAAVMMAEGFDLV